MRLRDKEVYKNAGIQKIGDSERKIESREKGIFEKK